MTLKKTTIIREYYYNTEEEKIKHSQEMVKDGYEDCGQIKENTGDFYKPEFRWYGRYYKYNCG